MNWDKKLVTGLLREDDGTPSDSRFLTTLVVFFSLLWITYVVVRTMKLPDLGSVAMFDTVVSGSLYGLNKVVRAVSSVVQKTPDKTD